VPPLPSIRARLLAGIFLSLAAILGVVAWVSYAVSRHEAEEIFGARLATSARVLEALVARQLDHATIASPIVIALPKELELGGEAGSEYGHPYETKIAFQVWREDGTLLARSASAPALPFSPALAGFSRRVLDGEPWQVFVLRSGSSWIYVAEKEEVRDELVHNLGLAVMAPLVAGAALLLVVVNLLVRFGLEPLRQLAASIARRKPDAPGRIEMTTVPRELAPVVQALNELLVRVKLAFEHERRFTDAAAHELRTPLAALKIHAENAARARSDAERGESLDLLLRGIERVSKLAAQMLAYSRAQGEGDREPREPIVLAACVSESIAALDPLRRARSQRVRFSATDAAGRVSIAGEPAKVQGLIGNLLDNAARYAPAGSTIDVSLSLRNGNVVLEVANPGSPIPPGLRERVFEPYYRVPGSGSEGSGLGLAIVKEIVERHHGTVALGGLKGAEGTVVTVTFPVFTAGEETAAIAG
jgi:two-component system sensor histidine kinase QseC